MKLALLAVFLALPLIACKSDDQGNTVPDWAIIGTELDLLVEDLALAAVAFPGHADDYTALADVLGTVDLVVDALEEGDALNISSAEAAVVAALAALEPFKGEEWAFVAGATLRRIRAYLPKP